MALSDTGGGKPTGQFLGAGVQFTVRDPGVRSYESYAPRLSACMCGEDLMQSFP
ncbi:hypothetical protein GCM10023335_44310 [Streptomyces siamensis]|uniref:Uncharacterized protein n=1 Tax=Streptomyces siamensis TaxID=1274986 RepID=A0ABP9J1S7_9ACTN